MFTCADCSFCKRGPLQFTVSNIHMDEDKRDEETKNKNSQLDVEKFKKDVASTLALAEQVGEVLCQQGNLHSYPLLPDAHLVS